MLAQITNAFGGAQLPDPHSTTSIGWAVVIAAGLVVIARSVIGLWRDLNKKEPEQRDVTIRTGMVGKPEFERHVDENRQAHEKFDARIGGVHRSAQEHTDDWASALRNERREDMKTLHHEINEVGKKVSALEATNVLQNQRLQEISAKLDRAIEGQGRHR